jgi:2-polyprenyl-6-methoxyphenol hydroxylase-like FAD-dependent oxidoreductase
LKFFEIGIVNVSLSFAGSATVLEKYDRERKFYVVPIITSLNLLKELFAAQSSLIVAARNFGLSFVNSFFPLKVSTRKKSSKEKRRESSPMLCH